MISIKTEEEIKIMKEGGEILSAILKKIASRVEVGITTKKLEELAQELIKKSGAFCNFKNYEGFPSCLCVSINEEVVHCVPSERILREGDIVSLDLGLLWKGFHTDMAVTLPVGRISKEAKRLIDVTKKALEIGIERAKVGMFFSDIGRSIQKYVESEGFNVVRELCGHGIGRQLHEEPQIFNYEHSDNNIEIQEGMVFCIEPMVTIGHWKLRKKDKYCFVTQDGSLSAHFEAMVAATKKGPIMLTKI